MGDEATNDATSYVRFRADGWPLCPWCGEDELFSLRMPRATIETIVGCYRCDLQPPKRAKRK